MDVGPTSSLRYSHIVSIHLRIEFTTITEQIIYLALLLCFSVYYGLRPQ
jgi:hypothetical protein